MILPRYASAGLKGFLYIQAKGVEIDMAVVRCNQYHQTRLITNQVPEALELKVHKSGKRVWHTCARA